MHVCILNLDIGFTYQEKYHRSIYELQRESTNLELCQ
jgi:hypothetical protein